MRDLVDVKHFVVDPGETHADNLGDRREDSHALVHETGKAQVEHCRVTDNGAWLCKVASLFLIVLLNKAHIGNYVHHYHDESQHAVDEQHVSEGC